MNALFLIFLLGSYVGLSRQMGQLVLCSVFMLVFGGVFSIVIGCTALSAVGILAASLTCFQIGYAICCFVVAPAQPPLQNDAA
jgi:hypothetical protein